MIELLLVLAAGGAIGYCVAQIQEGEREHREWRASAAELDRALTRLEQRARR